MKRANSLVIWLLPAVLLSNLVYSSNVRAEGINFHGEFTYTNSDSETTNKTTGETTASTFSEFDQRYNFGFARTVYPYLTLAGGAFYELKNATSTFQGTDTEAEEKVLRPFIDLNLNNPLYKAGLGYRRTQIENESTGIPATQDFRDEFNTVLGWKPAGLPNLDLRYTYTHTYNDPKTTDAIDNLFSFDSRYTLGQDLVFSYFYTRTARENKINDVETLEQDHNGKIDYSHTFFNKRLSLNTGYRIRYNTFEFETTGAVESPLLRNRGLEALTLTQAEVKQLTSNLKLKDGNVINQASAQLNIGHSVVDNKFRNIGLDFGFPVDVDKIYLWVDRQLSNLVANSFSWGIYTSSDNNTWTLHAAASGTFGTFENRFEIIFAEVNTRFIKVVTLPLNTVVSAEKEFANIYVTEMQAVTTVSGVASENETTRTDHNYNLNLRAKLFSKTTIGYNLFYNLQEQDPSSVKKTELSNGIYLRHTFNRVFSASTSVSQTDRTLTDQQNASEKSTGNTYAASLRAAYWEALKQILTYSGTKTTEEDGTSSTNSLFLRTNAQLYKGWSAFIDAGYSWSEPLDGAETTSTIIRSGTNVVPNDKITFDINYSVATTQQSGGDTSRSELDFQAFITPFRALTFNARFSMLDQEDSTTTLHNYSANWSPFPDGDLQFFFTYSETLRPEDDQESRTIGPSLKWSLSRHFIFDAAYTISESETVLQVTDSTSFIVNLRMVF